jgi:DNA-binding beta-propeller fold protein YncE
MVVKRKPEDKEDKKRDKEVTKMKDRNTDYRRFRHGMVLRGTIFIFLLALLLSPFGLPTKALAESYQFHLKWGTPSNQFNYPYGVAVDSSGNVYVADTGNHLIQKFTPDTTDPTDPLKMVFLTKWGLFGEGDGEFNRPQGVAVDSNGNVYVVDTGNNRVQKFSSSGGFLTKWGSEGSGDSQFDNPSAIAVDSSGNVYVADTGNHRIAAVEQCPKGICLELLVLPAA